mmetsp:Transcript_82004/g.227370  ORF Transcript_82004/g.227370 Transcript_82004/m.227370 type:complete len:151 (-) Transcript_82004:78-530(-)
MAKQERQLADFRDRLARLVVSAAERDAQIAVLQQALADRRRGAQEPADMQIFVRELTGRALTLKVEARETIDSVKLAIQDKTGIPPRCFYLTYGGKNLAEGRLVSDYNISRDCTLTMLTRLCSSRRNWQPAPEWKAGPRLLGRSGQLLKA